MNVYYSGFFGPSKGQKPLTPIPLHRPFTWEDKEGLLLSLYVGDLGAVLDLAIRIPLEELKRFLEKWPAEKRLELFQSSDQEAMENFEHDNPSVLNFRTQMALDDIPLELSQCTMTVWHPLDTDEDFQISPDAQKLMEAYQCDPESGWIFCRHLYKWKDTPILSPSTLSLTFQAEKTPFTVTYFTTEEHLRGETVQAIHPFTGKCYTVTLLDCKPTCQEWSSLSLPDHLEYPSYAQTLTYTVSPEPPEGELQIQDCGQYDKPREKTADNQEKACANGPIAVFMAASSPSPTAHVSVSAFHFQPVSSIRWRVLFQLNTYPDLTLTISLP